MRKLLLLVLSLLAANVALAGTAVWTGNKEKVEKVMGHIKWKCEYRVANTTQMFLFWEESMDYCPAEIEYAREPAPIQYQKTPSDQDE